MSNEPLSADIVVSRFVPESGRTAEVIQQIDSAIKAGDVQQIVAVIRRTQEAILLQRQQIDALAGKIDAIASRPANGTTVYNVYNVYSDNRTYWDWDWDCSRTDNSKTTTTTNNGDGLWAWLMGAMLAAVLLVALCEKQPTQIRIQAPSDAQVQIGGEI